jgi:hypothetical protein
MKELPAFARRIPGFDGKSFTDKIEIFAWYLHEILGKAKFTAVDVAECFDVAHSAKPANVHSLLGKLCEKKPVRMLRDTGGYRLTGGVRDQIGRNIGARATSVATTATCRTGSKGYERSPTNVSNRDNYLFQPKSISGNHRYGVEPRIRSCMRCYPQQARCRVRRPTETRLPEATAPFQAHGLRGLQGIAGD